MVEDEGISLEGLMWKPNHRDLGSGFIDTYMMYFLDRCKGHKHWGLLTFHNMLGSLPNIKKFMIPIGKNSVDPRVHGLYFAPSGTGKGKGDEVHSKISDAIGVNHGWLKTFTDAALIGGFDVVETINGDGGKGKEYVPLCGMLDPRSGIEVIKCNEANGFIFDSSTQWKNQETISYFICVMNPIGTQDSLITKRLLHGQPIEFFPNCSFLFSTFPPPNIEKILTSSGFVPRMFLCSTDYDLAKVEEYFKWATRVRQTEDDDVVFSQIVNTFKYINNFYSDISEIQRSEEIDIIIRDGIIDKFFEPIKETTKFTRDILQPFVSRWIEKFYIIMYHHCFTRCDTKIDASDVRYAQDFVLDAWKGLVALIEEKVEQEDDEMKKWRIKLHLMRQCYYEFVRVERPANGGWIPRGEYERFLKDSIITGGKSRTYIAQIVEKAIEEGVFEQRFATKHMRGLAMIRLNGREAIKKEEQ